MIRAGELTKPACVGAHLTRRATLAALAFGLIRAPGVHAAPLRIGFADILTKDGDFTPTAQQAAGHEIEIRGYMAPPLKPEINFFVLTKLPAAVCPFCDAAAAWPDDIVLVQMARPIRAINYDVLIRVTGFLDLGVQTDAATGFVSRVRVRDARYIRI